MAEGGYENPAFDPTWDDRDVDDDNDDDDEQEVDTTRPFQPGSAYTPYHGGEQYEMQTMQHEHSGQPEDSYVETPLFGDFIHQDDKPAILERAKEFIKRKFPRVDFKKLGPIGFSKKPGNETIVVSFGSKGGETEIFKKDRSGLLKKFTDKFKTSLGPEAESLIAQDNVSIRETRQSLREAESQLRKEERINTQKEKAAQEVQDLRIKIERTQAKMEQLGATVENESELRELRQRIKNYKTDFENAKKEVAALEKQARQKAKEQTRVEQLRASLAAKESKRNTLEQDSTPQKHLRI